MRADDAAERVGDDVSAVLLQEPHLRAGRRAGVDLVETGGAEGVGPGNGRGETLGAAIERVLERTGEPSPVDPRTTGSGRLC